MESIPFLIDECAYRRGRERWINIQYDQSPHILWVGRTSSGKSISAKILLSRTILLAPSELQPVEVYIIDPKQDFDFNFLEGLPRFYRGNEAPQGINDFFDAFIRRKEKTDLTRNLKVCFVDEFASLVNLLDDRKEREAVQRRLSLLLMLSRSYQGAKPSVSKS